MKKKILICGCIVTMALTSCGKNSDSEGKIIKKSTEKMEESVSEINNKIEQTTQIIETTTEEKVTEKQIQETTELVTVEETKNDKKKNIECYPGTDVPIFNKYYGVQGFIETDCWDDGLYDAHYPDISVTFSDEFKELGLEWDCFIDIDKCYREYDSILKELGYSKSDSVDEDGYDVHTYVKNNITVIITMSDYLEFTIKDTNKR